MPDPFTIRIYVPDGDPEGVRVIDRMNWTGIGVVFPRAKWSEVKQRAEVQGTGIYILVGYKGPDDDLPTLYIGQADGVRSRIESHVQNKDFWHWALVFASTSGGLNRAHATWLEYALVRQAREAQRCHLDNGNEPQEPRLTEAEKADTRGFLKEILQILPLVGLRAFEVPRPVVVSSAQEPVARVTTGPNITDTVIVPAQREGFERVFLGEDCWYAIRISGGKLDQIKYIAGYQTQPVSAITHYAPVARIEPYGEEGKYRLVFSEPAKPIGPIPFADAPQGAMQGPRYTSIAKLQAARTLNDLFARG